MSDTSPPRKRPQFYEVKERRMLENEVLREDLVRWVKTVGPISRMWLEAGWQMEATAKGVAEPSAHYAKVANLYNQCMQESLAGRPTLGEFRERMRGQEEKLPAMLTANIPELSAAQGAALSEICRDYCDRLVVGHLVTHMEKAKQRGGRG